MGTHQYSVQVRVERDALALQFILDASRIKDMVKTTAPDGTTLDEPLITQRTVQLSVKLPLNHTEVVFDSSTHPQATLTTLSPQSGQPAPLPTTQDVPLILEMIAAELP